MILKSWDSWNEVGIQIFESLIKFIIFILIWGNKESTTMLTTSNTATPNMQAITHLIPSPIPKRSWLRWPTELKNIKPITTIMTTMSTSNTEGPSILTQISAYSPSRSLMPWTQNTSEKKIKDSWTPQDLELSHTLFTVFFFSALLFTPIVYGAISEPRHSCDLLSFCL